MGKGWFLGPIFRQTLRLISKQPSMPLGSEKDPQKLSQARCRWRSSRLAHWSQGHCSVEVCGGNSLFHDYCLWNYIMLRHTRTHSELQVVAILFETSTIAERFDAKQMDLFARSGQCLHFQFTHRYFFEALFSGLTTCLGSSTIHPLRCLSCQRFAEGFASIFTGSHFCVSQAEASLLDGCPSGYGPPGADPFWPPGDHGNIQRVERDLVQNVQTLPAGRWKTQLVLHLSTERVLTAKTAAVHEVIACPSAPGRIEEVSVIR